MKNYLIALLVGLAGLYAQAAVSPVYVVDAAGEKGLNTLAEAYAYVATNAVPDSGTVCIRICSSLAVDEDITVDLTGKSGLTTLIVEAGEYEGGSTHARDGAVISVTGKTLAVGKEAPTEAGEVADVSSKLPAEAILEVRHLHLIGAIAFDAGADDVVTVHDCKISNGWFLASPAARGYAFVGNEFASGVDAHAVSLYYAGEQDHDLDLDFRNNTVQSLHAFVMRNADAYTTAIKMEGNTFVHTSLVKEGYLENENIAMGLCEIVGKVTGEVILTNNVMLGYYTHVGSVPALLSIDRGGVADDSGATWLKAGASVTIVDNDRQCDVVEIAYHGEPLDATSLVTATLADNRKVHLYPAETPEHSSICHICSACRQAIVRVEVKNGRIDGGVSDLAVVTNYVGYGFEISTRSTPNACILDEGETNVVTATGYEGPLVKYLYEGLPEDMNFTDYPWPHVGNTYELSTINNDRVYPDAKLTRCPCMKITFEQKYVSSANFHALMKVDTATTNVLIAIPWTFYTPDGSPSSNLPVNRLVRPVNLFPGDMLLNVRDSKVYESWMLVVDDYDKELLKWVAAESITGNTRVPSDKVDLEDKPSAEKPIPRGTGLWLVRTNPQTESGEWLPFYLYGQWAKGGALVTVDGPAEGAEDNAVMIAHPGCTRPLDINKDIRWLGVDDEDTLSFPTGTDAQDVAHWDVAKGQWWKTKSVRDGRRVISVQDYDITVPAGQGFWYVRRAPTPVSIEFVEK